MPLARQLLTASLLLAFSARTWAEGVLQPSQFKPYIDRFNSEDRETFAQEFPNAKAWAFLSANIPLFECPDKELEKTYYFRWWTFRKHLQATPEGRVITEFLPKVSWAGGYNTIVCASGHHIREARWLRNPQIAREALAWWLRRGGQGRSRDYSTWLADSVLAWSDVTGNYNSAKDWLPDLVRNYEGWQKERFDPEMGLFWQTDDLDGMEGSISKGGFRPTLNSYLYGDAMAIARIAELCHNTDQAEKFRSKAFALKECVQKCLWNPKQEFFEVIQGPHGFGLFNWRLNEDEALTRSASVSASTPGNCDVVKRGGPPPNAWNWSQAHFDFGGHVGTREWIQYDLSAPTTISSCSIFPMAGGNFSLPEGARVLCRTSGKWKEVEGLVGEINLTGRWNKLGFTPVESDGVRLELAFSGADRQALHPAGVRELLGYVPWYFNLPNPEYVNAWKQLADSKGFAAAFGLTSAEQRHPKFKISYEGHECLWNGPVWPFASAQTLTALANLLNNYDQKLVTRQTYFDALCTYARSHRLKLPDGKVVAWIDENQNPFTGDWIARNRLIELERKQPEVFKKKGGTTDRGKDYNHSTFCDLVINGLVGLRPQSGETVVVNPLVPGETWDYFCLDQVAYHGCSLTILWDRTGNRYGKGPGLRVFADGSEIAHGPNLSRVSGELPQKQPFSEFNSNTSLYRSQTRSDPNL